MALKDAHERLREFWDLDAETYDRSPSHAASDPVEASAWRAALRRLLPPPPASILDAGAGTGAISLLAAELGYEVTALDLSPGMLSRAADKAERRGLRLRTVVGPAEEPPPGPFDAVVERHLLWTTPDPVRALSAWRGVAPGGRLVLFEAMIGSGRAVRAREAAADRVRRLLAVPHDHHGTYDADLLASLPLARARTIRPLLETVSAAGWRRTCLQRLRDVEWARRTAGNPVLGWLEHVARVAVTADDAA